MNISGCVTRETPTADLDISSWMLPKMTNWYLLLIIFSLIYFTTFVHEFSKVLIFKSVKYHWPSSDNLSMNSVRI